MSQAERLDIARGMSRVADGTTRDGRSDTLAGYTNERGTLLQPVDRPSGCTARTGKTRRCEGKGTFIPGIGSGNGDIAFFFGRTGF
jgi:hypothetical protein